MPISDQTNFLLAAQNLSVEQLGDQLDVMAEKIGKQAICQVGAEYLVSLTRPERVVHGNLGRFGPMVRDGIAFFLSQISYRRLRRAILSQKRITAENDPGIRLLDLALHFPTLHKLGQVIARTDGIEPRLKKWLITLEKGHYGTDRETLIQNLDTWLMTVNPASAICLSPHILAEGSVAAVFPFTCRVQGKDEQAKGVFKVLKPEIEAFLKEEMSILERVAVFFENNREIYGLKELKVVELFREVQDDLVREIDLTAEQKNLLEAAGLYRNVRGVHIPRLFSFCTTTVTAMEFLAGIRITDVEISPELREKLARRTFEAIICTPLFSTEEVALFHGDPHAGNILAVPEKDPDDFTVALIDWTLAGRLSRTLRGHVVEMMVGIISTDIKKICVSIRQMISDSDSKLHAKKMNECVAEFMVAEVHQDDPLKKAFLLMAEMAMLGYVFPADLILFRKTFFTLEGVLADISPGFNMAEALENYLGRLLFEELPLRVSTGFFPLSDSSINYRSLISNQSLGALSFYQAVSTWQNAMKTSFTFVETQAKVTSDIWSCLWGRDLYWK
ncbi:MAG: AarF/UbiB family protein [Desulforhopalus sp.]